MYFNLSEWLNLIARWIHVFAGIMWIGQTYFFTWLDGRFTAMMDNQGKDDPEGKVWMVHSGGFYVVEKQKVPKLLPSALHWFKWEAATTWLSGVFLLVVVYYLGGLMVEEIENETSAIVTGVAFIIFSWPVYDFLWKSPLAKNECVGAVVSFFLIVAISYALTEMMGARAAYMHLGAIFGTLMTANVWMVILPSQRKMVAALKAGEQIDLALGQQAKTRSKHNTFMVVPVVFIMISSHFPTATYGSDLNWLVLSGFVLVGWGAAAIMRRF